MPPTPMWHGSFHELGAVILPFCGHVSWLKYAEGAKDAMDTEVLVQHRQLIIGLSELCPQLSFKKATVKAALFEVAKTKQFVELMNSEILLEWVDVMSARLRLVCRHVAHSRSRPTPPAWLQEVDDTPRQSRMSSQGGGGHAAEEARVQDAEEGHGQGAGEVPGAESAEGHGHGAEGDVYT